MDKIHQELSELNGDLSDISFQDEVRDCLMANREWAAWIEQNRVAISLRPILVRAGLGIELDDDVSRKILVGLARCMEPGSYVPPYEVGNLAVTKVIAKPNSTPESHSMNDLPAPPHCAGFFEDVPPHTCYFACIRAHPQGGGETTVVNLERVLDQAPQALIDEWTDTTHILKTSKRLGNELRPFKLLSWKEELPFLRYRKEYTKEFEQDRSLVMMEELLSSPSNHFIVLLQPGETLIHWNGTPHSRLAQNGETPQDPEHRRKLIRCRPVPRNWGENFKSTVTIENASAPEDILENAN